MVKRNKTAKRQQLRPKPFQQGDLDGLCGVYSIVNAVRVLCPEVDAATAEYLFDILLQKLLLTVTNPSIAVSWGIGRLDLMSLGEEAITYMLDDFDIRLRMRRLPKTLRKGANRDELLNYLRETVTPACVAIVGLSGRHSHWTVATQVTAHSLRLADSSRMRSLSRAHCTVRRTNKRHQIVPMLVVLIERL